jgi:hypothetical protein
MQKSYLIIGGLFTLILIVGVFLFLGKSDSVESDQASGVISDTYQISTQYVSLRYRTDNLLREASGYADYETWQAELNTLIAEWQTLEQNAVSLEQNATLLETQALSQKWLPRAQAAETYELSAIFDAAPAGKKIATLAKHLGTDAKTAYKLLQIEQAQIEADGWNEAGNTFKRLETQATVLKDACKVTTYVGTIVATGGLSAVAAGSTLTQAAIVVSGADLVLEVTSDAAQIGLGDDNKISSVINGVRVVTEPVSSILTITSLHENLATGFDKFNAVIVGLEQFNNAAQDGKIAGIKLPNSNQANKNNAKVAVSVLSPEEISVWLNENNASETKPDIIDSIITSAAAVTETTRNIDSITVSENNKVTESEQINQPITSTGCGVVGIWEGMMEWTGGASESESEMVVVYDFRADGTVVSDDDLMGTYACVDNNTVHMYEPDVIEDGYHEFALSGDTLTFVKIAGPDEEGTWSEVYAGEDFFGGKYLTLTLTRQ